MISQFSLRVGVSGGFLLSQITMFGFSLVGVIAKIGQCKPTVTYWVNSGVLYFIIVIILQVPVQYKCILKKIVRLWVSNSLYDGR